MVQTSSNHDPHCSDIISYFIFILQDRKSAGQTLAASGKQLLWDLDAEFHCTFSGETGWRVGGGGQGSAHSDLSGPGRGFGGSGGGDRIEVCGVSGVTHLVFRLQHETSGQE